MSSDEAPAVQELRRQEGGASSSSFPPAATDIVLPEVVSAATTVLPDDVATPNAVQLTDQTNYLPTRQVIVVFLGLSVALACSYLDQTIVATALPRISSDLHSGQLSSWVATSYLLTSLAFTPLYGRWSDIFGRKAVLLFALGIFLVSSLACALASTMIQLIVFRAFQGIGGGAILTMVYVIVGDVVALKDRGKYQGVIEAITTVSNGVGPVLGGVFSTYTTWRWAFWINLPLAGLAMLVAWFLIPVKPVDGSMQAKLLKVDWVGSGLTILSSVLVLIGLTWGGSTYPWTSAAVLVPLLSGMAVVIPFVVWEARYATLPIIPVHLFRNKTVLGVYITSLLNGMTFFAVLYYIPQFLQLVHGLSAVTSSLLMLPFLAPVSIFVSLIAQVVSRTGHYRYFVIGSYALWSVAEGIQTTLDKQSSVAKVAGIMLFTGFACAGTFQTSILAVQAAVPRAEMAVATGARNFVRLLGNVLGVALCGALVQSALRTALAGLALEPAQVQTILSEPTAINDLARVALSPAQRDLILDGYMRGFKAIFYLTTASMVVATLVAAVMIEQIDLSRRDAEEGRGQTQVARGPASRETVADGDTKEKV